MPAVTRRIPLLRDHHNHPLLYAAFLDALDLNRDEIATEDDAVERIRAHARSAGGSGWSIVHGWNNGRFPLSAEEFQDLPPLVIFNLSLHGMIVNDTGRRLLADADPEVAAHLDDFDWTERNLRRVLNVFAMNGASVDRLHRFYSWLLETHGVVHAEEMLLVNAEEIRLFDEAGLAERTRFWAAPELYWSLPTELKVRVHGVKLFADGALGVRTAALHEPYRGSGNTGLLLYETGEFMDLVRRCLLSRKPIAIHAIGDRAIDQVVTAVAEAGGGNGSEVRIEHAQFISLDTARRAKALGIILCMQPNFSDDSTHYTDRLPPGHAERNNPFRMLIDQVGFVPGEDLLFGSDGMPHGVVEGLRQALFPPFRGQALTLEEFVAGYCVAEGSPGHIDVTIDREKRTVACRIEGAR